MNDRSLQEIPHLLDQTDRDTEEMIHLAKEKLHQPISYASPVPSELSHPVVRGDGNLLYRQISHPSPDLSELSNTVVQGESHPYDDIQLDITSDLPEPSQQPAFLSTGTPQIEQAQFVAQVEPDQEPVTTNDPTQAFDHINNRRGPRRCQQCGAAPPNPHRLTCHNHPHNGGTGRGGRVLHARRGGRGRHRGGHIEINSNGHVTVRVPPRRGRGLSSRGIPPRLSFSVNHGRMVLSSTDANGNLTQWFC